MCTRTSRSNAFIRLVLFLLFASTAQSAIAQPRSGQKVDPPAARRMSDIAGRSRVIVQTDDATSLQSVNSMVLQRGGRSRRALPLINARVVDLPNAAIAALAANPLVKRVWLDRPIAAATERTGATIGATAVRQALGFDGSGVGVAVIDSGITTWHDDLTASGGGQRVDRFVDLVNERSASYDDLGHGTHVAGIIAGNGFDSSGARAGVAPGASLTVIKVIDATGRGYISDVIAAIDYAIAQRTALNIRIINLSVAAGVYESYETDPLTLAAKRAVDAGLVVVAAAGNNGRSRTGQDQYGGIGAPGNAPWVLTVGASSHAGTADRTDDTMAAFSSRGPTAFNFAAKPDLVAPGIGIESLSDPNSLFYTLRAASLLSGTAPTSYSPYLSLSGTSMAAPVVAGTVALMLQANPSLTPNAVKAILQYTAEVNPAFDPLTEGAGFLNAQGAVELARFLNPSFSGAYPTTQHWRAQIVWGNHLVGGGRLTADANAWATDVTWGAATNGGGQTIEWGVTCVRSCDRGNARWEPWRAVCLDGTCDPGSTVVPKNVVWGSACGGADCSVVWTIGAVNDDGDTVVWGTSDDDDTVVWGTSDDDDTVVWGTTDDDDTVVWGTSCSDPACAPVVWPAR